MHINTSYTIKHALRAGTAIILISVFFALVHVLNHSQTDLPQSQDMSEGGTDGLRGHTDGLRKIYDALNIEKSVCYSAFRNAYQGFGRIGDKRKNILAVADFSKPSTIQRFVVIDMDKMEVLYTTYVAHGRNSGENYANSFSNVSGSHKSSLGFYLTDATYEGRNGYSLLLNGLEKGINDRARERAIVMHGADYCDPSIIASAGRLGRSFGCPALPFEVSADIIDAIKGGSVLFIYADCADYIAQSTVLKGASHLDELLARAG